MSEPCLEHLDIAQLRQLARLQAEKLSELEQQLALVQQQLVVAQALAGHAPLMAAPQVKWQPTGDGFVVWTERPAPPPKPEAG